MRSLLAAAAVSGLAAACSQPADPEPPPVTADEQRALAEARAMIPAGELPAATPTPSGSAAQ